MTRTEDSAIVDLAYFLSPRLCRTHAAQQLSQHRRRPGNQTQSKGLPRLPQASVPGRLSVASCRPSSPAWSERRTAAPPPPKRLTRPSPSQATRSATRSGAQTEAASAACRLDSNASPAPPSVGPDTQTPSARRTCRLQRTRSRTLPHQARCLRVRSLYQRPIRLFIRHNSLPPPLPVSFAAPHSPTCRPLNPRRRRSLVSRTPIGSPPCRRHGKIAPRPLSGSGLTNACSPTTSTAARSQAVLRPTHH